MKQVSRDSLSFLLFNSMNIVEPYPDSVAPVKCMVATETAFFPGGKGLWLDDNSMFLPDILVLGQDFSTEEWYDEMFNGKEKDLDSPTWINMISLFKQAKIDLNRCFFSNVFMGLRRTKSMTGKFPGFKDRLFVKRNIDFLSYQIKVIKPKVIITLGKYAAELLTSLSQQDLQNWKDWQALRAANVGFIRNVKFLDHICNCIALEHPSMRYSNVKRRRYQGLCGNEAEVKMLEDATV